MFVVTRKKRKSRERIGARGGKILSLAILEELAVACALSVDVIAFLRNGGDEGVFAVEREWFARFCISSRSGDGL